MRKILNKGEKEKKETRNKLIVGLILVVIMVLSTVGYAFFSNPEEGKKSKIEYNGIEFVLNENSLWQFNIQNIGFLTQYNPKETENISVPIFVTASNYAGNPLFFVGGGEAKQEIARNLGNFVLRMQDVCLENYKSNEECKENFPIKNCSQDNVIIIEEAEDIKISEEDNCVFIAAPYEEQMRASDAFIFKILGIRNF